MTREPLILSDTAMVLLREHVEIRDALPPRLHRPPPDRLRLPYPKARYTEYWDVQTELMREMWLLWMNPDIPLIRHLNWHLSLTDELMLMAPQTFLVHPPEERTNRRWAIFHHYLPLSFVDGLDKAYREACAAGKRL